MIKRSFWLLMLALAFAALLGSFFAVETKKVEPLASIEPEPEPEQVSFTGRMIMPSLDDLYVLDNSAGRDLEQFAKYIQGRAAGLHWLATDYFKKRHGGAKRKDKDVYMGVKLTLDSLGRFDANILFSNTKDQELKSLVCEHIQAFWRYPRSTQGKFEVWVPIIWTSEYSRAARNASR